jgi:hypothetical protein
MRPLQATPITRPLRTISVRARMDGPHTFIAATLPEVERIEGFHTDADEILVLDDGRIVERRGFRTLAIGEGLFARMVAKGGFTVPKAPDDGAVETRQKA